MNLAELDGLILIAGKTGAGKTSFMNSLIIEQMYNKERYRASESITEALKWGGFSKLTTPPHHICYTETFCQSTMVGKRKYITYHCDAKKFSLPTKDNKADFYPPYSVLGFDEIQQKFDKRKWALLKSYFSRAWELRRHNNYTVYCASQYGNVDSSMRELFTYVISVEEKWLDWSKDKYAHRQSCWSYKVFETFADYEAYRTTKKEELVLFGGVHSYDGDIRKCYDGEGYRAYWYNGRENENYTQEQNVPIGYNARDFRNFNERNAVV